MQAFVYGPLSQAGKAEARRLQETVAEYLAPMLDIITAMPAIQVSRGPAQTYLPTQQHRRVAYPAFRWKDMTWIRIKKSPDGIYPHLNGI